MSIMKTPVILDDGHSYERTAIEAWFGCGNRSSPLTGSDLDSTRMVPNTTLRKAIEEWKIDVQASAAKSLDASMKEFTISWDDIRINKRDKSNRLGKGAHGVVWKGSWHGVDVACKSIGGIDDESEMKRLGEECRVLSHLRHPNVVQLLGSTENDDGDFYLIMEFASMGSLRSILKGAVSARSDRTPSDAGGPLGWNDFFKISLGICHGLGHLHSEGIVHCDLKSLNVLVFGDMVPKIADFGLAKAIRSSASSGSVASSGVRGTTNWMAPEMLSVGGRMSTKSDVYSLGVLIWEIFTGELPYAEIREQMQVVDAIKTGKTLQIPQSPKTTELARMLALCWQMTADKRPSVFDVCIGLTAIRTDAAPSIGVKMVNLLPGTEFSMIRDRIEGTFSRGSKQRILVEAVYKVYNPALESKFLKQVSKLGGEASANIEPLLHGTSKQATSAICNDGFREPTPTELKELMAEETDDSSGEDDVAVPDFPGLPDYGNDGGDSDASLDDEAMTATVTSSRPKGKLRFGKGIYFTTDVGKAAFFSEERGATVLLICDVAMGRVMTIESVSPDLTLHSVSAAGCQSVSHYSTHNGEQQREVVVYRPDQALVRYMVVYRAAKLQTTDRQIRFEKQWQSKSQRKKKSFAAANVEELLENAIEGRQKDQETSLDELGSLCRDDCSVGARCLDDKDGFWKSCFRILQITTCEPVHWFILRLFHNYAYDNSTAQGVLHRCGGTLALLPVLESSNEAIVQKASIAMCNMSQGCSAAVTGRYGFQCTEALVNACGKASENLTKIYIVCGLRNFLSSSGAKLEPDLRSKLLRLVPSISKTLMADGYRNQMWLSAIIEFGENLVASLASDDLPLFATKGSTFLSAVARVFSGDVRHPVDWHNSEHTALYRALVLITSTCKSTAVWSTSLCKQFEFGIRDDLKRLLRKDGMSKKKFQASLEFFMLSQLLRFSPALSRTVFGGDSILTNSIGKFMKTHVGTCDDLYRSGNTLYFLGIALKYVLHSSKAAQIGGLDEAFLSSIHEPAQKHSWTLKTGSIGGDGD